jgi:LysM repeat protein
MRKTQPSIIILVVIVTTILAVASSLALLFIQNRPETPQDPTQNEQPQEGRQTVNVEGVDIIVNNDPNSLVFLMPDIPEVAPEVVQPTEPTAEAQPPQVEAAPQPTQESAAEQQNPQPQPTANPSGSVNMGVSPVIFRDYTVQANDSLYNITRQLDTSITLMAVNGIDQSNLVEGTVIRVPVGNPEYCPGLRPYAIGEGDTVFAIATRRNTTVETLRAINNLNEAYAIKAGEILCVP